MSVLKLNPEGSVGLIEKLILPYPPLAETGVAVFDDSLVKVTLL